MAGSCRRGRLGMAAAVRGWWRFDQQRKRGSAGGAGPPVDGGRRHGLEEDQSCGGATFEPCPSALDGFDEIIRQANRKEIIVFLDYDGTLSPIVTDQTRRTCLMR
ncbi:hypothetical protein C2845_PM06G12650 [Panicum miliaceum]|uniref:Uncharacterized protein n=1 Tax=Panicum miliaceum TaxID=4540 RepID=A0A3L6R9Z9_PANMI|nr:hypothetical protein C2845_PM06G12650 [Panicum miliaceum]